MDLHRSIKYALDRLFGVALLVLLSPLLALIAVAIRIDTPGSPLFLQERIGAHGRAFTIFKFRTMVSGSEKEGLGHTTAPGDERITRVGRILRALSLDELPQLLNIVVGEMSFIGPRPTLRYQVQAYTRRQRRRLLFRPGITGWAQVHGRNEIPWAERIEYDLYYVDHHSLGLDLSILYRTVRVLLKRDGVYAQGRANDGFVGTPDAVLGSHANPAAPIQKPLLVVGAGGHARVVIDIAEKQGAHKIVGILDEDPKRAGTSWMGYPILGGRETLAQMNPVPEVIVALGAPATRKTWQEHLEDLGCTLAVLVHPAAVVGREVTIGAGSVLMAGAIVNSGTCLGRGVIVNTAASIDHDCDLGDFVHVSPGAHLAGGVHVGSGSHLGIGCCVLPSLRVGSDVTVGGGAVVVRSVPDATTVVGVPARPLEPQDQTTPTPLVTTQLS